jgi:hypothetical protein
MRCSLLVLLAACGTGERSSLVDHSLWAEVVEDPFDDAPGEVICAPTATRVEVVDGLSSFEVDTGFCNYLTLEQPTLRTVFKGDRLDVRLGHGALVAEQAAEAHVAVLVGELVLWDDAVLIPSPPLDHEGFLIAPERVPKGTPVVLHLHNHGDNSWQFDEISVGPDEEE